MHANAKEDRHRELVLPPGGGDDLHSAGPAPRSDPKPAQGQAVSIPAPAGAAAPAASSQLHEKQNSTVLRLATANVCTLDCPGQRAAERAGLAISGRTALLEGMFHSSGYQVVGIQEARLPGSLHRDGVHYRMYTSPGTQQGTHGVQCWIHHGLTRQVMDVRAVSPRLLGLVLALGSRRLAILVPYAPQSGCKDLSATRDRFYDELDKLVDSYRRRYGASLLLVFLGDFNGKLGSVSSPSVGNVDPEEENDGGMRLRQFAEAHQLIVANTFLSSQPTKTWCDANGTWHRIDYAVLDHELQSGLQASWVDDAIDLSTAEREDHRVVGLQLEVSHDVAPSPPKARAKPRWHKHLLRDYDTCQHFRQCLALQPRPPATASSDEKLEAFNNAVSVTAQNIFCDRTPTPRKKWLSTTTWELVRPVASLRRASHSSRLAVSQRRMRIAFEALRHANAPDSFCFALLALPLQRAWHLEAQTLGRLMRQQAAVRLAVRSDRIAFIEHVAADAADACARGDTRQLYSLVQKLGGYIGRPDEAVINADGSVTCSPEEHDQRWLEHFVELFDGTLVDFDALPFTAPSIMSEVNMRTATSAFRPTCAQTKAAIDALPAHRATGPDDLPAEVLRAGGEELAERLHDVIDTTVCTEQVPIAWKGGQLVNAWKRKGDPRVCGNHRGLLLGDHSGKVFTSMLKESLDDPYLETVPNSQCGCTKGKGTSFVSHTSRSFLAYCRQANLSAFILFLDLAKAFDFVIREYVMGVPQQCNKAAPLSIDEAVAALGLDINDAQELADEIRQHASYLHMCNADPKVAMLVNALHSGTWFRIGDLSQVILVSKGSRQGCKLGSLIFNFIYARALKYLQARLVEKDVLLKLPFRARGTPWHHNALPDEGHAVDHIVFDTTYVDDEAILLAAPSPAELDKRVGIMLEELVATFSRFKLTINWDKGKTEALLVYRGDGAGQHLRALYHDGLPWFLTPDGCKLHVVHEYKHVGSLVAQSENLASEAQARADSALRAWYKTAARVFGSRHLPEQVKLSLADSLIFSRLYLAVETWAPEAPGPLRTLEAVQTRVLRRIAGNWASAAAGPCSDGHHALSNEELRRRLGVPAVETELRRRRLLYLPRLAQNAPDTLRALLQASPRGKPLPWVTLLVGDLQALRDYYPHKLAELPSPLVDSTPWVSLAVQFSWAWRSLVKGYVNFASALSINRCGPCYEDPAKAEQAGVPCTMCPQGARRLFASTRAMRAHQAKNHGVRREARHYVEEDGRCPACWHSFHTRQRAIIHLQQRAPKCQACMPDLLPLSLERLAELEAADAKALRAARRAGHPTPLAQLPGPQKGPKKPLEGSPLAIRLKSK